MGDAESKARKARPRPSGYFIHADARRRHARALALRSLGAPRVRAPDDALARGRARRARAAARRLAAPRPHLPQGERARGRISRAARGRGALDPPRADARRRGLRPRGGAAPDGGGDPRARGGRDLPAVPHGRPLAGVRGLPREALGRRLRAGRHEARPHREAEPCPPALLLRRAARADPGLARRAHPRRERAGRAGDVPRRGVRVVLPPGPRAVPRRARREERDVPVAVRPLRDLRFPAALLRAARRGRPPDARRGRLALTRRVPAGRGDRDARSARRGHPGDAGGRASPGDRRGDAPPGRAPAPRAPRGAAVLGAAAGRGGARLLAAPRARRGRRVVRHGGPPLLRDEPRARIPLRLLLPRRRGRRRLRRRLGARPRRGATGLRDVRRLARRATPAAPGACTSTTTRTTSAPR